MKNFRKILYIVIWFIFFSINKANSALFGTDKINTWLMWDTENVDVVIQDYTAYLLWFLYLVAVIYWLYGWFKILTAWEDDDKVKSWKTIIIQALFWILIIFLAGPIVNFFLWNWGSNTGIIWE